MATYVTTYDLTNTTPSPYATFLEKAQGNGWNCWILSSDNTWYRLPNTTLVGTFDIMDAAERAFNKTKTDTATAIGRAVTVEKFIITQYSAARFNSNVSQPKR